MEVGEWGECAASLSHTRLTTRGGSELSGDERTLRQTLPASPGEQMVAARDESVGDSSPASS